MKVKLMYVTEEGYEWLEEIIDVNDFNYMSLIDDYIVRNQVKAESLENKWRSNGEDVTLILDVEPIDGQFDYKNEFLVKVSKYIDNI
jgi:cystathionine beta-lyase family protein involved in aluminum resistance